MKKILFVLVLFFTVFAAKAEMYEEGKVWIYEVFDSTHISNRDSNGQLIYYYMKDTVDGDTLIGNKKCKKIKHENLDDEKPWWSDEDVFWTYEYEDSGCVYRYDESNKDFTLLMDFNVQVGDSVTISYFNPVRKSIVFDVEYIPVRTDSQLRKRIMVEDDILLNCWFEDVGLFCDLGEDISSFTKPDVTRELRKCFKDGELMLSYYGDIVCKTGVKDVITDSDESAPLYDLMGHRVEHPQRGSLYIRDGKKLIWQE